MNTQNSIVASLSSTLHLHPFGMQMPGRSYTISSPFGGGQEGAYRFGFNGMEKDDEMKGSGNSLDFGARIYDSRLGRWLSTDALEYKFPYISSFVFASNNPIYFKDSDGKEIIFFGDDAAFNKFKTLIEKDFDGNVIVSIDNSSKMISFNLRKGAKLTENQNIIFNELNNYASTNSGQIKARVGDASSHIAEESDALFDSYAWSFFDLNDNEKLPSNQYINTSINFMHYLTEQYHKQVTLNLGHKYTNEGYEESHHDAIVKDIKVGSVLLLNETNLGDNTLNGKRMNNVATYSYDMVNGDGDFVGRMIIKILEKTSTVLNIELDNSSNGIGGKYEFKNYEDKAEFEHSTTGN